MHNPPNDQSFDVPMSELVERATSQLEKDGVSVSNEELDRLLPEARRPEFWQYVLDSHKDKLHTESNIVMDVSWEDE